jgi:galactose mutarotase-like enzyme
MAITESTRDGLAAVTLEAEEGIQATFVPDAGMVACSLLRHGEELLGQRGGLHRYVTERSTMGIPLLYPWANRVSSVRFEVAGREVVLDAPPPARSPKRDPNGLPIHGLLSADGGWQVDDLEPTGDGGTLRASLDFDERPDLMAAFPFPHLLRMEATVAGTKLTIATTVDANAGAPVPIAFGFHPYLRIPAADRADWEVELPVTERLALDDRMLPSGEREPARIEPGPLGARKFDDAFVAPAGGAPFVLAGAGRRIELSFEAGYPFAQIYAPADDQLIAIEPMTAPTNALVSGGADLTVLASGERYEAVFSIEVS